MKKEKEPKGTLIPVSWWREQEAKGKINDGLKLILEGTAELNKLGWKFSLGNSREKAAEVAPSLNWYLDRITVENNAGR